MIGVDNGRVQVRLGAGSGCSACDAGKGCGAGIFGRLLKRKPVVLDFENALGAAPGQAVMVGLPESLYLSLTFRFYLYPLLAALAGAAAGHGLAHLAGAGGFSIDLAALTGALLAAFTVLSGTRRRQVEFSGDSTVHLLRIADCRISRE